MSLLFIWAVVLRAAFAHTSESNPVSTTIVCSTPFGTWPGYGGQTTTSSTTYVQLPPVVLTTTTVPSATVTAPEVSSTVTDTETDTETTTLSTVTDSFSTTSTVVVSTTDTSITSATETDTSQTTSTTTVTNTIATSAGFLPIEDTASSSVYPGNNVSKRRNRSPCTAEYHNHHISWPEGTSSGWAAESTDSVPTGWPKLGWGKGLPQVYPQIVTCELRSPLLPLEPSHTNLGHKGVETIYLQDTITITVTGQPQTSTILPSTTAINTDTTTVTTTSDVVPPDASTTLSFTETDTSVATTAATTTAFTTISTETLTATSTVDYYAACASNNLLGPNYQDQVIWNEFTTLDYITIYTDNAYDCCVSCITSDTCAGSFWSVTGALNGDCELFQTDSCSSQSGYSVGCKCAHIQAGLLAPGFFFPGFIPSIAFFPDFLPKHLERGTLCGSETFADRVKLNIVNTIPKTPFGYIASNGNCGFLYFAGSDS